MVNPVLGFFSTTKDFLQGRDTSLIFAFCVALISVYFPVMWDTSSNFFMSYFGTYWGGFGDTYRPYISIPSYFMFQYNFDFYYFIFFSVFFITYTWSRIVYESTKELKLKYKGIILFSILLLTFNYRDILDLNRSALACSIFFYYIFLIKNKNILKFLFFISLSIYIHNFMMVYLILYILSFIKLSAKINKIFLISSLFLGISLPFIVSMFSSIIVNIPIVGSGLYYYLYGDSFGVQTFTLGALLKRIVDVFLIGFVTYLILSKDQTNNRIVQLILYSACLCLVFSSFVTFFERSSLAFSFLYVYVFSLNCNPVLKYIISTVILFRNLIMYSFAYIWVIFGNVDNVITNQQVKYEILLKPFYYPTPMLLNIHDNGYSNERILNNSIWGKELSIEK
ncbi:EpsG family protein [Acinetobacter soli]|nr:EpsG family protein [Acinetobacter soli]